MIPAGVARAVPLAAVALHDGKPDRALPRYRDALKKSKDNDQIRRIKEKIQRLEKKI